jgi:hypothetical protein
LGSGFFLLIEERSTIPIRPAAGCQNSLSFGASSLSGSFFAVCSFQPPPRAFQWAIR